MPGSPWFQKNVKEVPLDRFTKCSSVFPGECRRSSEEKNERQKNCHLCFFYGSRRQVETGRVRSNPLLYISTWTDYELMLLENSGMMLLRAGCLITPTTPLNVSDGGPVAGIMPGRLSLSCFDIGSEERKS